MEKGSLLEGKYRILGTLGQGGMGKVYLAENIKLGTLWAIKHLKKKPGSSCNLYIEPNILKKLNHPALPRIFDIFEDAENVYIVVDYIEGVSLDKKLEEVGCFPEEVVLEWAAQLCDVLMYLHSIKPNPIIYRDMKPANIILTEGGRLKLIDFGIAREYKSGADSDTICIGTRGYAAPEQYGAGQTSFASDIYSLGVTLYHLLTGKSPNEAPYEIKPVRWFNSNLSSEIEDVILKCTRLDPSERYQSVQELIVEIERIKKSRANDVGHEDFIRKDAGVYRHRERDLCASFKKLVLAVWDNAEFGCELAYMAAKLTGLSVLLIDLDLLSPKADLYLNIRKYPDRIINESILDSSGFNSSGLNIVMDSIEKNFITHELLLKASVRRRELKNLYILTGNYNLENYEYYSNESLVKLIEKCYQQFDVVILLVNKSIYDSYTVISLAKSDYNIVPIRADIDVLREFNNYLAFLKDKQKIPLEKTKFVAFEYNPATNLALGTLRETTEKNFIGCISYSAKRARCRNLRIPYVKRMERNIVLNYINILNAFCIVPKPGLYDRLNNILRELYLIWRSVKKAAAKITRTRLREFTRPEGEKICP
ncbi:MAG TPA: protein kinase [Clostridiaceae bacterium]|nr:protein kinase [Clostridiaceae bacterium]